MRVSLKVKKEFVPQLGSQPSEHYLFEDHQKDLTQQIQRVGKHLFQEPHRSLQPEKGITITTKLFIGWELNSKILLVVDVT